ncbi:MAG: hypothetical protein FWE28_09350 [Oscillospiraceae bacterium]|nr:hypothetical protein [Oscillospiraceae bacterium]
MKKTFLTISMILFFLFLGACSNEHLSEVHEHAVLTSDTEPFVEAVPVDDNTSFPAWIMEFFDEEELASGEMLTLRTSGDYQTYRNLEDMLMFDEVTDILMAEVLDERVEWLDYTIPFSDDLREYLGIVEEHEPRYEAHTVHRLHVLEVFQGGTEVGDIVEIAQLGGQLGNFTLINDNMLTLAIGDVLVFFLSDPAVDPARLDPARNPNYDVPIKLPMILANPWQTVYRFPAFGEGVSTRSTCHELESVNFQPVVNLTLELGDLVQIWINNLDSATDLDTAISAIQVHTTDGESYTLDELADMPHEEVLSVELTQESLQAILDSGAVLAE